MNNKELMELDLKYIWHPCSQMKDYEKLPIIPIKSGKGIYLYDYDGNSYIDGISSWWVNILGHSNKTINRAIKKQIKELEHTLLAGFSHYPAITLAQKLSKLTKLDKLFFADNGSSGVEIALKMAFHHFKTRGEVRKKFLSFKNSYHGETLGALAVGDVELYKDSYKEIIVETIQAPIPNDLSEIEAINAGNKLKEILNSEHQNISAIIIEPLVQCAGGMKMHSPLFIKIVRDLSFEFGIFLIVDEVAVGFGRTGTMFAYEQANIKPDFLVLSKALSGGYLPISVVMTTNEIYNSFYCDYLEFKSFLHSHSYSGNPIACACANATIDILLKDKILEKNLSKIEYIKKLSQKFKELQNVKEIRQCGMILAIELINYDIKDRVNLTIFQFALKNGLLIRPLGNVIYFMPPYIIKKREIKKSIDIIYSSILNLGVQNG